MAFGFFKRKDKQEEQGKRNTLADADGRYSAESCQAEHEQGGCFPGESRDGFKPKAYYLKELKRVDDFLAELEKATQAEDGGNSAAGLAARIILGIVCALVLANTLRAIATSVYLSLPQSSAFVDVSDLLFLASTIFDVFMRLLLATPAVLLLVYAVRSQGVPDRVARIALVFWWALWLVGLGVYVFNARDAVTQEYFAQLIAWHVASALAPAVASVCVWFIQKGGESFAQAGPAGNVDSASQAVQASQVGEVNPVSEVAQVNQATQATLPSTGTTYKSGPRVALGIVAGIVLAGCVLGALALVGASLEEAELASAGASGHEYLGALTGGAFGIIMLIPAMPAILCMVFACKPWNDPLKLIHLQC